MCHLCLGEAFLSPNLSTYWRVEGDWEREVGNSQRSRADGLSMNGQGAVSAKPGSFSGLFLWVRDLVMFDV